jgi:hypothetical protein
MAGYDAFQQQYEELCKSYRAIDDFRAKLLGFLPLASGAGWITLVTSVHQPPKGLFILVGIVGAVITFGLWIFEARGAQRCRDLKRVAKNLEAYLGLNADLGQFRGENRGEMHPRPGVIREFWAGVFVYLAVCVGWLGLAIHSYRTPEGFDLRLMSWGDGTGVPTTERNLVIVGTDTGNLLHIRIFDASGNLVTDTDETKLCTEQAAAIATLKQRIAGLLPPHAMTDAEKAQVISEATSIVGQTRPEPKSLSQ